MTMPDPDMTDPQPVPPEVRFVKRLVVVLTGVMIVGITLIVGLLVLRLSAPPAPLALPEALALPEGVVPSAVTLARNWVLVLDTGGTEVLLFDRASGALRHRLPLPVVEN
jgi:hypothetical protein